MRYYYERWVYLLIDIYIDTIPKFVVAFSFLSYIIPTIFLLSCLRLNNQIWGKFKQFNFYNFEFTLFIFLGIKTSEYNSIDSPVKHSKKIT